APLSIVRKLPQSPRTTVAPSVAAGCPSATRFVTNVPVMFPVAEPGCAVALACATTLAAVISPPKTETVLTSADADAVAFVPAAAETLHFRDRGRAVGV